MLTYFHTWRTEVNLKCHSPSAFQGLSLGLEFTDSDGLRVLGVQAPACHRLPSTRAKVI